MSDADFIAVGRIRAPRQEETFIGGVEDVPGEYEVVILGWDTGFSVTAHDEEEAMEEAEKAVAEVLSKLLRGEKRDFF